MQRSAKDHQRLSALGKTLAVLEAVTDHPHGIGLPDLAASLGLPRQTVHRLLGQLQSSGLLLRDPARERFLVGPRLTRLSLAALGSNNRWAPVKSVMQELVDEFRLGEVRKMRVGNLSGGQRRRCEIAITLACEPSFAMLDEPFAGVDPHATDEIGQMIHHLADRDIGVLITDHKARELLGIVDRAYVIDSGRVLAEGDVEEIVGHQDVRRVYLGEEFRL